MGVAQPSGMQVGVLQSLKIAQGVRGRLAYHQETNDKSFACVCWCLQCVCVREDRVNVAWLCQTLTHGRSVWRLHDPRRRHIQPSHDKNVHRRGSREAASRHAHGRIGTTFDTFLPTARKCPIFIITIINNAKVFVTHLTLILRVLMARSYIYMQSIFVLRSKLQFLQPLQEPVYARECLKFLPHSNNPTRGCHDAHRSNFRLLFSNHH